MIHQFKVTWLWVKAIRGKGKAEKPWVTHAPPFLHMTLLLSLTPQPCPTKRGVIFAQHSHGSLLRPRVQLEPFNPHPSLALYLSHSPSLALDLSWHWRLLWDRGDCTEWTWSRICLRRTQLTNTHKPNTQKKLKLGGKHTQEKRIFLDHDGYCCWGGQGPRYWTICQGGVFSVCILVCAYQKLIQYQTVSHL